jgi:Holliday junction resolvasome RuvABC endonuclease subunit
MTYVVGIDQSTKHTGVCILTAEGSCVLLELIEPKNTLRDVERLAYVRNSLRGMLNPYKIEHSAMEGYSYHSLSKKFLLGEVGSAVKLVLYDFNIPLTVVAPKQLKKFVTSRGDAEKSDMITCVNKQWEMSVTDDNLADAYGLARIALELVRPVTTKRHQLDIVNALLKKPLPKAKARRIKTPFSL